jgi:hypothetical protein
MDSSILGDSFRDEMEKWGGTTICGKTTSAYPHVGMDEVVEAVLGISGRPRKANCHGTATPVVANCASSHSG